MGQWKCCLHNSFQLNEYRASKIQWLPIDLMPKLWPLRGRCLAAPSACHLSPNLSVHWATLFSLAPAPPQQNETKHIRFPLMRFCPPLLLRHRRIITQHVPGLRACTRLHQPASTVMPFITFQGFSSLNEMNRGGITVEGVSSGWCGHINDKAATGASWSK